MLCEPTQCVPQASVQPCRGLTEAGRPRPSEAAFSLHVLHARLGGDSCSAGVALCFRTASGSAHGSGCSPSRLSCSMHQCSGLMARTALVPAMWLGARGIAGGKRGLAMAPAWPEQAQPGALLGR